MDASLLALPWQLQLSLASGYAAYALAYIGIRSHHQTVDIAFRTLVFSAIATLAFHELISRKIADEVWASVGAFVTALLAGFLWRAFGRSLVRLIMRSLRFSFSDDEPSAWAKLGDVADHDCIQIAVRLSDGSWGTM